MPRHDVARSLQTGEQSLGEFPFTKKFFHGTRSFVPEPLAALGVDFLVADHGEGLVAGNDVKKDAVAQRCVADVQTLEFRVRALPNVLPAQFAVRDKNPDLSRGARFGRAHRVDKLGADTRTDAVVKAARFGLLLL